MSPRCSVEQPTKPRITTIENAKRIVAIECRPNPTAFNKHRDFRGYRLRAKPQSFHFRPTEPRRDQRAVCLASRAARRPVPLSTTPVPLRKPRARHEFAWRRAADAAGFRLRPGGGTLRSGCDSLCAALRSPLHFPRSPIRRPTPAICHAIGYVSTETDASPESVGFSIRIR